jgi:hypothetical protein
MQLVARPRPRFAVIPTKSASLSRPRARSARYNGLLLFDQMHGEIVGFVQRKVGLSTGRAPCEFERRHWRD